MTRDAHLSAHVQGVVGGVVYASYECFNQPDRRTFSRGDDETTTINKKNSDSCLAKTESRFVTLSARLNQCVLHWHAAMAFPVDLVLGLLAGTLTLIFYLVYK